MNNPKLDKAISDIARTKAKIAEHQGKLREQEREKIRLENEQIVALVRSERISDAELNALMQSLRREEPNPAEATVSAKENPRQEERRDANTDNE
jgi:DNA-binding helix-hairpin-helix protein with protein kinase domain